MMFLMEYLVQFKTLVHVYFEWWKFEQVNDQMTSGHPSSPKPHTEKKLQKKKKQQNQSNKKSFFYTWYMLGIFFCGKYNTLDLPVGTGF